MTEYKKILSCWHKLEHFSPASVPKGNTIEELNEREPWNIPLIPINPNKTIEYTIYLGVFESRIVNDFVKEYFQDTITDENFRTSKICYASLNLDIEGKYINDSFGISTLPWALGQLQKDQIANDNWSAAFEKIKEQLINEIDIKFKETITNDENEIISVSTVLSKAQLIDFQGKIESLLDWSIKPEKSIYIKRIEKYKPKNGVGNKSQADILNSFYIKDLEKIISKFTAENSPKAFLDYIKGCLNEKSERTDISKDIDVLKQNLSPQNYPDGCWPSEYTLSLMQQYAVNNIFNDLSGDNQRGMFSVNGPPGTGKTTLLRDIIAPIIVKRAKALSHINNPYSAFIRLGQLESDGNFRPWIYTPNESLCQAGIVIASSNNGAVENISKELPLKEEVSSQYREEIEYFKDVAEQCISENNWGIISAVLGNKQNRRNLVNSLWFNNGDFKDLQKTLREDRIIGTSEWDNVVSAFNLKLEEVLQEKQRLEGMKKDYEGFVIKEKEYLKVEKELKETTDQYLSIEREYIDKKDKVEALNNDKDKAVNELSIVKDSKPGFFTYWFNRSKRRAYKKAHQLALEDYNNIREELKEQSKLFEVLRKDFEYTRKLKQEYEEKKENLSQELDELSPKIEAAKLELKGNFADSKFWDKLESKKSQESCPWYSAQLKKAQSELFVQALKLNEIFLLTANATSSRISTTLAGFFEYLKGNTKATREQVKGMWNTFFLVIPVVSSTFASIQTMFKDLDREEIPWLFIDEAGQAVPQSAAGSIWRSKRVGVVGDPFQIEPVVTIPDSITNNISQYFELNKNQINSELSVQSMADRINPLGSYLTTNNRTEWIGIPLRVHRRCINPMFDIANKIAYDNTMYCSTFHRDTTVNFQTSFIDCTGNVEGRHFVREQANIIKDILVNEISIMNKLPDIFVISPFSEISYKLRSYLFPDLIQKLGEFQEVDNQIVNDWLKSHIGTVHTFQGKQAEGVILCLGLDERTRGAASWASKKPNLLNVAITRAKYRFIAVGDESIWLNQAYFNELNEL